MSSRAAAPTRPLPLSKIVLGKNPRGEVFDVTDLQESFDQAPQIHPILVRRLPGDKELYEVIAGYRRLEAARLKGWGHIEAKVVEATDEEAEQFALEENLRRKDLHDEVGAIARLAEIYEARGAIGQGGDRRSGQFRGNGSGSNGQLSRLNKSAVARIAEATDQSESEVRRKSRIGKKGSESVRAALAKRQINILEADKLVRLERREQDLGLKKLLRSKKLPEQAKKAQKAVDALSYAETFIRGIRRGELAPESAKALRGGITGVAGALDAVAGRARKAVRDEAAPAPAFRDLSGSVKFEATSCNRKLGPVALAPGKTRPHFGPMAPYVCSTLVSVQATCSDACAFKGTPTEPGGCYVDAGFTRIAMQKLDAACWGVPSLEVVREEVRQIDDAFDGGKIPQDGARGGRDLRLHVGGDVGSTEGAKALARAARRWRLRGGGFVWTYTHDWREVPRSAWGDAITVFASVEKPKDIEKARKRGYPAAIVVERFPNGAKAFWLDGSESKITPCPAETRQKNCIHCRLCLDRDLLALGTAIAFNLHGQQEAVAKVKLEDARGG